MLIKISVIMLVFKFCVGQHHNHDWDLAVVIDDQIELLQSNGTLIGSTPELFSKLKALTFDSIRHQFIVSDMDLYNGNDTIFSVQLTKETIPTAIIQDLPDDVQGLAIDPITYTLYWTDTKNKTINYASLNDTINGSGIVLTFNNENPHGIAIDICRRYIYWTNANVDKPTIERVKLDGSQRSVLINADLKMPVGIAIDYHSQRLYWADVREGIYFRIESTNLDGKEREVVFEGTHGTPFGIAVNKFSIYWTDVNNNALWKINKMKGLVPQKIRQFKEKPMGIIAKNMEIRTLPDCKNLAETEKNIHQSSIEVFQEIIDDGLPPALFCLNDGKLTENGCSCRRGFTGNYCEISLCHNFCVQGDCHLSSRGYPRCHCPLGFTGVRCEENLCNDFCLNEGLCTYVSKSERSCICKAGFNGSRCEIKAEYVNLCDIYCRDKNIDVLTLKENQITCNCTKDFNSTNITTARLFSQQDDDVLIKKLSDPWFLALFIWTTVSPFLIASVVVYMCCVYRKKRPRIKKRIIVNKNVQPLTYRPQPTEQCEITIENCCNMNVCETPCFEPPKLRTFQKNDDKKTLLSNMENGEDLY